MPLNDRPTGLRRRRRGMTLLEFAASAALLTVVTLASLRVMSTARRVTARDQAMTNLTLAANTQLARLRAADWSALAEGVRELTPHEMAALGVSAGGRVTGKVTVRAIDALGLKEITVHLERDTAMGPAGVTLATLRARGKP